MRRGSRSVAIASTGAPATIPRAYAEISSPAVGTDTPSSAAISGSSPASMNSEVPCAKIANPST
ncbi:hypothetical protein GCM10010191_35330 [Actinomadura vinacea]|uniref:Uncharacterized protein n=1 Tax=Actinomadura vinacea TaxID=115336 RepID=A0ABN3J2S5_9ACTN